MAGWLNGWMAGLVGRVVGWLVGSLVAWLVQITLSAYTYFNANVQTEHTVIRRQTLHKRTICKCSVNKHPCTAVGG